MLGLDIVKVRIMSRMEYCQGRRYGLCQVLLGFGWNQLGWNLLGWNQLWWDYERVWVVTQGLGSVMLESRQCHEKGSDRQYQTYPSTLEISRQSSRSDIATGQIQVYTVIVQRLNGLGLDGLDGVRQVRADVDELGLDGLVLVLVGLSKFTRSNIACCLARQWYKM